MKLADVLLDCRYEIAVGERLQAALDTDISGITYDSRKAGEGSVFVAIKGESSDGHNFIGDAIKREAAAIIYEKPGAYNSDGFRQSEPVFVRVDDTRKALACISSNFYGRPSERISVIGVTGTNGKTTTTYLIKAILEAWAKSVGLIGTITYIIGDRRYPALHTTPESPEFQGLLAEMAAAGCNYVTTEVSSHALFQKRVDYTRFIVAVFTNLTRDHLDFHGTMENYYISKRRLFEELLSENGAAVINVDDEWGRRLKADIERKVETWAPDRRIPSLVTYGIESEADVSATGIEGSFSGVSFTLKRGDKECRIDSPLVGLPNVYNLLAAISVGIALKVPMDVIREGIKRVASITGRLETVDSGQDFLCIIDYAHTPDALERLLYTARELGGKGREDKSRIITVFGCGGDRDRGKRPLMGEIATRLSDCAIITSDNPRSENPLEIIKQIVSGISENNYELVPDRREAIIAAVEKAGRRDIVIIAGKGHEDYQETGGIRHRFSDREVAEEAIRDKLKRCGTR